jgi:hypothetical protein
MVPFVELRIEHSLGSILLMILMPVVAVFIYRIVRSEGFISAGLRAASTIILTIPAMLCDRIWIVGVAWSIAILLGCGVKPIIYGVIAAFVAVVAVGWVGITALVANQGTQWRWHLIAPAVLVCIVAPTIAAITHWSEVRGFFLRHEPKLRSLRMSGGPACEPDLTIDLGRPLHGGIGR